MHDASFSVGKGEIFCIMGLSGSGKSTLIRLLNRLIDPSLGEVLVKGRAINGLGAQDLRDLRAHTIGMVFQNVALIPIRTVLENAAFGLEVQGLAPPWHRRIAIMKDGAVVQTGTAEEIGMNPADQYVADFVAGISRIHLVKAASS